MKKFVFAVGALVAGAAQGQETAYGFNSAGNLFSFNTATPTVVNNVGAITGIAGGQTLRGVDFRPVGGALYGLSVGTTGAAQVYTIDLTTAVATPVGAGLTLPNYAESTVSIDFNPAADRLRVVTRGGLSYRINQLTGALAAQDTSLTWDASSGRTGTPSPSAVAYTNNVPGAPGGTTLYSYEYNLDRLVTIGGPNSTPSPNGGLTFDIGSTGFVALGGDTSFDISGQTSIAYSELNNSLYTVNLGTGAHTLVGAFGTTALVDFSVVPAPGSLALLGLGALTLARRRRA